MFGKKKAEELNLGDIVGSSNSRTVSIRRRRKRNKRSIKNLKRKNRRIQSNLETVNKFWPMQ